VLGIQGQAADIDIHAKEILYLRDRLNEILAKHTNQKKEKIARDTDRNLFMNADEAQKYGIVDEILLNRK